MNKKQINSVDKDGCYIGVDDNRCLHDIVNNIYPCDSENNYVLHDTKEDN